MELYTVKAPSGKYKAPLSKPPVAPLQHQYQLNWEGLVEVCLLRRIFEQNPNATRLHQLTLDEQMYIQTQKGPMLQQISIMLAPLSEEERRRKYHKAFKCHSLLTDLMNVTLDNNFRFTLQLPMRPLDPPSSIELAMVSQGHQPSPNPRRIPLPSDKFGGMSTGGTIDPFLAQAHQQLLTQDGQQHMNQMHNNWDHQPIGTSKRQTQSEVKSNCFIILGLN